MTSLLDVNVLLALLDEDHVHHEVARDWMMEHEADGWASCVLTENGFVRIISQPAYPGAVSVAVALDLLAATCARSAHEFWPADVSVLDVVDHDRVLGPRQLTDLYLLALAARHGGRFVTFDARVPVSAVAGATSEHLTVIGAKP